MTVVGVNGLLLLDKPFGLSSNVALQRARRLFDRAKAGHTGTLDPYATGLLPLCFGEATRFSAFLLESAKTYEADIALGAVSTTGDGEGDITPVPGALPVRDEVDRVLAGMCGAGVQQPPMHSAVKHQGRPLYAYARAGMTVERKDRAIEIHALERLVLDGRLLRVRAVCSKGTYIRVLAEDIGRALGCGGYLTALRRTASGAFHVADAISLDGLAVLDPAARRARLLPVDRMVAHLPALQLDAAAARALCQGRQIPLPAPVDGIVRLYGPDGFVGLGQTAGELLLPRRMLAAAGAAAAGVGGAG